MALTFRAWPAGYRISVLNKSDRIGIIKHVKIGDVVLLFGDDPDMPDVKFRLFKKGWKLSVESEGCSAVKYYLTRKEV